MIAEGPFGYEQVNVADQRREPSSLLNWTERLIRMRKECPEIGWGELARAAIREPPACWRCATTGAATPWSPSTT